MSKDVSLYFVSDRRRQVVKIGISTNPQVRLRALQAGSPVRLEFVALFSEASRALEEAIHCGFSALWSHGEWFTLGNEVWDFIEACELYGVTEAVESWRFKQECYADERGNKMSKYEWLAWRSGREGS